MADPDDDEASLAALRKEFELAGARALLESLDAKRERILRMFPELGPRKPRTYQKRAPAVVFDSNPATPERNARLPNRKIPYRTRRQFTPEFKAGVVARIKRGEFPTDLMTELGLHEAQIRDWSKAAGVTPKTMPMDERVRRNQASRLEAAKGTIAAKRDVKLSNADKTRQRAWTNVQRPMLVYMAKATEPISIATLQTEFDIGYDAAVWRMRTLVASKWATAPTKGHVQITDKGRERLEQPE